MEPEEVLHGYEVTRAEDPAAKVMIELGKVDPLEKSMQPNLERVSGYFDVPRAEYRLPDLAEKQRREILARADTIGKVTRAWFEDFTWTDEHNPPDGRGIRRDPRKFLRALARERDLKYSFLGGALHDAMYAELARITSVPTTTE